MWQQSHYCIFVYFPHHKVEATEVFNRLSCILSEELLINQKNLLPDQVLKEPLWVYGIKTSTPSLSQIIYIMSTQWKACLKVQSSHHYI